MPKYTTQQIRNVSLVGHGGAGKTTLVEAMLHQAGLVGTPGTVEKGNSVSDFDPLEKEHQHSLAASLVSIDHGDTHLNVIDTPGYPDFIGQSLGTLAAVETAAVVVNAQAGIEMITRRMLDRAEERKLCRMIVINKIDADNVDLPGLVDMLAETFGSRCLPINLPAGDGVIDVLNNTEGESDFSSVADAHTNIVDQIVEVDEELMEKYLEEGQVKPEELLAPFGKALREGHLIPICFTSARTGVGVKEFMDLLAKLAPSPAEGNAKPFVKGEGDDAQPLTFEPDPDKPLIGHVFKLTIDPFVGKLGVFRIHQGKITKDSSLHVADERKSFRIAHLLKLQGKDHDEIDEAIPGDICAAAKIEEINFDAVIHDGANPDVRFETVPFPSPMHGLAIEAKSRGDETKISRALAAIDAEDPCFTIERNPATNETVIRGLGDLHMRVVLEKMKQRFNVEVETKPPKIAYRETIQGKSEGHHRHKKQTGGAGQFGEVYLRVEPNEPGAGFEFINDIFGGAIPQQFLPAVEKGVQMVMNDGCIAGYPMQDIKVSVYDGKYHPVDSKEVAFVTAGKRAFIDAVHKAKPSILEPIVELEITVPEANMGDIAGDLSQKRGRIQGTESVPGGMTLIKAQAPLAELGNYQSQLKSVTGGQGSYTMEFSHYEPVPGNVQQQIVAQYKPREEED
jgi:elongation factor G